VLAPYDRKRYATKVGVAKEGKTEYNFKQPSDLSRAVEVAATVVPVGRLGLIGKAALDIARAKKGEEAIQAGATLARAGHAAEEARTAERATQVGRATEEARPLARGAQKLWSHARTGARTAGKGARFGKRHPFVSATGLDLAAQAPVVAKSGDPSQFKGALEGTGTAAGLLGSAGSAVKSVVPGVAGNALSDLISLPAQVPPSVYLVGKAGVEAAQGRPQTWERLKTSFLKHDALALLAQGKGSEALKAAGEHPVYTGLEALGVKAAVGRGVSAPGRLLESGKPVEQRPPLHVYGERSIRRGPYSRDAITAARQRLADRRAMERRPGPMMEDIHGRPQQSIRAKPRQARKYLADFTDRTTYANEQVRRGEHRRTEHELAQVKPRGAQADVVSQLVQGIARDPERAIADLRNYRDNLVAAQRDLSPAQVVANRATIKQIDAALKSPDPERVAAAATAYVRQQAPVVQELVDRGLLSARQAEKSVAIPYARTHMGASHGLSQADRGALEQVHQEMRQSGLSNEERGRLLGRWNRLNSRRQTLDQHGNPLSLEAIHEHMRASGVHPEERGFVTQRLGGQKGPISHYRTYTERNRLPSARRTGEATAKGTADFSWDALVNQAVHSRSLLDSVKSFDRLTKEGVMRGPGGKWFKNPQEARLAIEHPAEFGMQLPEVPGGWVPWRIAPFLAKRGELEAARQYGEGASVDALHADIPELADTVMRDAIEQARAPGEGDTGLIPKVVADRLAQHFQPALPVEKTAQAITGGFKGAVLPTSPGWAAGNIIDNYLVRALSIGGGPVSITGGRAFGRSLTAELGPAEATRALESIVPGGLYGSYKRVQPYRAAEQFVGTRLEPVWRAAHALRVTPGPKQLMDLYGKYRDAVFEADSKFVEQTPQYGALSRAARRDLNMTRLQFLHAVRTGDAAVRGLARGLRNTDEQIRYAREVEKTFGNWGKNSPQARRFLTTWAPFWMWARASARFVLMTLPRDHPITTALLSASEQMTREERQKLGYDFNAKLPLPGFLQSGIPGPGGSAYKLSNLTSFGTFADYPQFLASIPAPQFSALVLGGLGLDWKGDKLVDSKGREAGALERVKAALAGTLDGYVPFLNPARQYAKYGVGGLSPVRKYPKSTVDYLRWLQGQSQEITVPIKGAPPAPGSKPSGGSSSQGGLWSAGGSSGSSAPGALWSTK
jgi:hypothetical protein